ncbi:MAG TPA: tetratricopeptide repeat protein [Blastocatellia bacterium]|nr:tetratricopeptide repeat protein [Blastocatellia bacterium]
MNEFRLKITALASILILFLASQSAPAQTPTTEEADALFKAQKWPEAAKAYEAIAKAESQNGRAWFRLGAALHAMGNFERAVWSYQRAVEIGGNPIAMYNLACSYARLNDKDKAFEWLNKSIQAGFNQVGQLSSDNDLAGLRDDSRFKEVSASAEKMNRPCQFLPEHKQFDFWVGDWDVQTAQGQPVGTNTIQRIEDGCIVLENWTGLQGGTGKSMNFYNAGTGKWRQVWVSSTGGVTEYQGEYKDGAMRYEGDTFSRAGKRVMLRLTFFNQGADRVRQFSEQSTDGGKTWTTQYDFIYVRKK